MVGLEPGWVVRLEPGWARDDGARVEPCSLGTRVVKYNYIEFSPNATRIFLDSPCPCHVFPCLAEWYNYNAWRGGGFDLIATVMRVVMS